MPDNLKSKLTSLTSKTGLLFWGITRKISTPHTHAAADHRQIQRTKERAYFYKGKGWCREGGGVHWSKLGVESVEVSHWLGSSNLLLAKLLPGRGEKSSFLLLGGKVGKPSCQRCKATCLLVYRELPYRPSELQLSGGFSY